ncbi:MAG: HAMP domain-containing protein [Spirochaetaceae bacterium]|nr:HAMP domain-containing protein [Spirochaetaceae bacterium]
MDLNTHSISFRILGVSFSAFILTAILVIILAQIQLTSTIDSSQNAIYEEKINTIISILAQKEERLEATNLRTSYIDAFQESVLQTIEDTYYHSGDLLVEPFIFDAGGHLLIAPLLPDKDLANSLDFETIGQLENSDYNFVTQNGEKNWCIFRTYPPWGWTVGYVVPLKEKYSDSRTLRNMLIHSMIIIIIIVLTILSIIIKRMIKPVLDLTSVSQAMADGDFSRKIHIAGKDEIATLARNFAIMGDVIREKITDQEMRISRTKRLQKSVSSLAVCEMMSTSDFTSIAQLITEKIVQALRVERASIWILNESSTRINCVDLFEESKVHHSSGLEFTLTRAPLYYESIEKNSSLVIRDVLNDKRSSQLTSEYFIPNNITSILDTAIYVSGKMRGIVCIENVGHNRDWEIDEIAFAGTMAELTAQVLVNCQKFLKEKELGELQILLSNIINSMPSAIVGVNRECRVIQWNNEAEEVLGIATSRALGQPLGEVFTLFTEILDDIYLAVENKSIEKISRVPLEIKGDKHYFDIAVYPLSDDILEGAVIRIDDVTDKLKIDEMMVQSKKMLSVGGLAAGMAHEINNPLAGLMQTANVLANRLWLKLDNPANRKAAEKTGLNLNALKQFMSAREIPRMIQTMNDSGKRVAELVQNMLSFARKSEAYFSSHDVVHILDKAIELASTDFDLKKKYDFKKIKIIKEFEADLPLISCDPGKIQQVILNLFHNGLQAMHSSGTINPQFTIRAYHEKKKRMLCVEIEDNGPGMEEEVRKRVFEPFFTTKPSGIGTGLGLSVSYFIITDNHKGEMSVESSPGTGAKFKISLPEIS